MRPWRIRRSDRHLLAAGAKSKWVNEEILAFKRLGREDRIFCIIVGGEPNASDLPGREAEECFPPALRFRLGPDGNLSTARTEPIAADARPGKDGKNNAKLKLISGLLGVGYDSLRRREQQRRNRAPVRVFVRGRGRHGAHHRPRRLCARAAGRRAAPDVARRGRGAHRQGDDALSRRSVQDLRPQRSARQHGDGARDARQGRGRASTASWRRSRPSRPR